MPLKLQTYDDSLEDVLSLDIPPDSAVSDKPICSASMFGFLFKEEPFCKDDLRALQKDRQKKDNHNISRFINWGLVIICKFWILDLCIWNHVHE